jgi:hypothetical protein
MLEQNVRAAKNLEWTYKNKQILDAVKKQEQDKKYEKKGK